jgi:predicted alpha/beta-fold hydrolase
MSELPGFAIRPPWWGPDLQTLRNFVRRPPEPVGALEARRLLLPLGDGDVLSALLERPRRQTGIAVLLVHGLGGCEDSAYMRASAAALLAQGRPVVRLNLRGAGRSGESCRGLYHAGRSDDLRVALAALPAELTADGVVIVGFSLGGNVILKLLGEGVDGVRAAATVSAPIDLAAASACMLKARNWVYHAYLLRRVKRDALQGSAEVSAAERAAIQVARSVFAFDDAFVAPRNGWRDAAEYYAVNSAEQFLARVATPTLVMQALDDPWIPADAYRRYPWGRNRQLTAALAPSGGHVGFHARGSRVPWHDRALAAFLAGQGV